MCCRVCCGLGDDALVRDFEEWVRGDGAAAAETKPRGGGGGGGKGPQAWPVFRFVWGDENLVRVPTEPGTPEDVAFLLAHSGGGGGGAAEASGGGRGTTQQRRRGAGGGGGEEPQQAAAAVPPNARGAVSLLRTFQGGLYPTLLKIVAPVLCPKGCCCLCAFKVRYFDPEAMLNNWRTLVCKSIGVFLTRRLNSSVAFSSESCTEPAASKNSRSPLHALPAEVLKLIILMLRPVIPKEPPVEVLLLPLVSPTALAHKGLYHNIQKPVAKILHLQTELRKQSQSN
ncbi:hypothetical protein Pelo_11957 [Pelomyxa schiedti]|nr:hypothetical protein Pelo_11957 [Pelomyxa schiedti]